MKRLSIGTLLISTLFLSCTGDIGQPEPEGSATTGRTLRREVTLQTTPMQGTVGEGITRATTEVPLTEDESKIHSLFVLQFGGTEPGSKLLKNTPVDVSEINTTTGVFNFNFEEPAGGGEIKVYLIANIDEGLFIDLRENTTTLGEFEGSIFGVAGGLTKDAITLEGLPMIASQSFDVTTTNPDPFKLKSCYAKVVFKYRTIDFTFTGVNLSVENLADFAPVTEPTAGTSVQHPAGITYGVSLDLIRNFTYNGTETTCYLLENLSGQVAAITQDSDRGGAAVPQEAAYLYLAEEENNTLNPISYRFYLGDGTAKDFNLKRHCLYTVDMTLRGANTVDKRVVLKTANCYLITAPGTYAFDATARGNNATGVAGINYNTLPDLSTATEARVLWQTGTSAANRVIDPATVKLNSGKVSFTTGSDTEGNAVIGVFASSAPDAPCLWSWHIWRLNGSAPGTVVGSKTPSPVSASPNVTMMDRNLGAYNNTEGNVGSIGLVYQWGRKDPFPGPAGFNTTDLSNIYGSYNKGGTTGDWTGAYNIQTVAVSASVGTELYATQYPTTFITSSGNWMSTQNDNLWGTPWIAAGSVGSYNGNQGIKSIYDPCPIGYRVPPHDTLNKQTGNGIFRNKGLILDSFNVSLWLPAAGYRVGSHGRLFDGSSQGFYWSSSRSGTSANDGGSMNFNSSGRFWPQGTNYRAYGFPVRCVKE